MKKNNYAHLYSNWDETVRRRKVFLSNPVFIKGLALAPLVVAATSVKNGLLLSLSVLCLLTPTRLVSNIITRKMSVPLKTFFYPFVSAIIFAVVYYYMYKYLGAQVLMLGVYLPILIVDPLIVKNFEKTRKEEAFYSIINGLRNTAGFVVACLIISAVREFLAFGTVAGYAITKVGILPMAQNSCGGFLIIGVLCAVWSQLVNSYKYKVEVEALHDERFADNDN